MSRGLPARGAIAARSWTRRRARVALGAALAVVMLLGGFADLAHAQLRQRTIDPLGPSDIAKSERQRDRVQALARRHLGLSVTGTRLEDLDALQRLISERYVDREDAFTQQCLGLVLGDIMAATLRLEWIVVDDDQGHSRALRRRGQQELFFPITMISKRMRFGEAVDVRALYQKVADAVAGIDRRS